MIKFFKNILQAFSIRKQLEALKALLKQFDDYFTKFLEEQEKKNKVYRLEAFFLQANGFYMSLIQSEMLKSYLNGKNLYSAGRRTGKTTFITTLALFESTYYNKDLPIFCETDIMAKNLKQILKKQQSLLSSNLYEQIKTPKVISLGENYDKARGYRRALFDLDYNPSNYKRDQFFSAFSLAGECFVVEGFY